MRKQILLTLVLLSIFCNNAFAQVDLPIDSIIRNATLKIYEDPDKAITIGQSIYNNEKYNPSEKLKGLTLMADGYSSKRDYKKSLEYVIKANQLADQIKDPITKIKILNKLAAHYQQLKIFEKALQFLDESEEMCINYPVQDSIKFLLGNGYIIRGFIYKDQLNCEIAINYFQKGIRKYEGFDPKLSKPNSSIAYYNIGNCYALMGKYSLAKESYNESINYAKTINANSLEGFPLKGLAEVYTLEGNYQAAIDALKSALLVSESVGDLVLNLSIYKGLSENYLAINDWQKYRENHLQYLKLQLENKISERVSISNSLNENRSTTEKRLEEKLSNLYYGILMVIILSTAIILFIIFKIKKFRKNNLQLQKLIDTLQNTSQI